MAKAFKEWWATLTESDVSVFSDGSEQRLDGAKQVTYGYAIYRAQTKIATGRGSLHPTSHVFDAEAVGAWRGLQHATEQLALGSQASIYMCIDSTSVIWGIRGNAPNTSQWAFLRCQDALAQNPNVQVRWAPGHTDIEGNELADQLADAEAQEPSQPQGLADRPTVSGVRSIAKHMLNSARKESWASVQGGLSDWYTQWNLPYQTTKAPEELRLPRPTLARLLAIRTTHGDFAWYHTKYNHEDANLQCSCRRLKSPDHLVRCSKAQAAFRLWPQRPYAPPDTTREGLSYLKHLVRTPEDFATYLQVTEFYTTICRR